MDALRVRRKTGSANKLEESRVFVHLLRFASNRLSERPRIFPELVGLPVGLRRTFGQMALPSYTKKTNIIDLISEERRHRKAKPKIPINHSFRYHIW